MPAAEEGPGWSAWRLLRGVCPTHGISLRTSSVGDGRGGTAERVVYCPWTNCDERFVVHRDDPLDLALRGKPIVPSDPEMDAFRAEIKLASTREEKQT